MNDAYCVRSIALSEKGWTSNYIGTQWFEKCFIPQATARNATGNPILLIYDGHRSHETIELREAADRAGIHLFCIPPHTSHRLQPLDVGVFGPLQRAWQKRCLAVLDETGESITRRTLVREYMTARTMSITEDLVVSAWRRSGIRPLNPQVFTEEDYAPSYASSINPPLPVSFPGLANSPNSSHLFCGEIEGNNDPGADSDAASDASGLNDVTRGSSSKLMLNQAPDQEITTNFPLLAPSRPTTPPPHSNETRSILCEEGRREPPNQPGAQGHSLCRMQIPFPPPVPVNTSLDAPRHQTRSVSRSASCTSSRGYTTQSVTSEHVKVLKETREELKAAQKRIEELENSSGELRTHCHFMHGLVTQLQNQLQAKGKKRGTHAKRTTVEARVLTSEEGRLELQQLREEARQKEHRQAEETARKATEDDARRKRRADHSRVFTGPLNKSRRKEELEDIAVALALPESGKKDELLERICNHFDTHPELKTTVRFEGLFNSRPRKRPRLADTPVAGPSAVHEPTVPGLPPPSSFQLGTFAFEPATTSH